MTLDDALPLSTRLVSCSLIVQTLELLTVRHSLSDRGIWRASTLREGLHGQSFLVRAVSSAIFPYPWLLAALGLQLSLACAALVVGQAWLLVPTVAAALLVSIRFRGAYNGGSDAMTLLTLFCLSATSFVPASVMPTWPLLPFGYLALQTCLSYFVAGLVKLRDPGWRRGTALASFAVLPRYAVPRHAREALTRPQLSRWLGFVVMAFECSFPLALLSPRVCTVYLTVGLVFHVTNAALLGLNRFLWAWLSAYPALYYVSQLGPLAAP